MYVIRAVASNTWQQRLLLGLLAAFFRFKVQLSNGQSAPAAVYEGFSAMLRWPGLRESELFQADFQGGWGVLQLPGQMLQRAGVYSLVLFYKDTRPEVRFPDEVCSAHCCVLTQSSKVVHISSEWLDLHIRLHCQASKALQRLMEAA